MTESPSSAAPPSSRVLHESRTAPSRIIGVLIESVVLILVVVSPWAFGAVEAEFEFVLFVGVAVLAFLWGVRAIVEREFHWSHCPVALCLAGLFVLGVWQLVPFPRTMLDRIAPATGAIYAEFLPSEHELVPGQEENSPASPGSTVSLYPTATRRELVRLLAVFLLFAVVRNNPTGIAGLLRLSIVALVNGSLLAYLGIAQYFSSPRDTLYWTIKSPGLVFGPFINRNHFAFYVDICVGFGLGLLFYVSARFVESERRRGGSRVSNESRWLDRVRMLAEPRVLGIGGSLAFIVASSFLCLSRGGFIALAGATCTCGVLYFWRSTRLRLETVLIPLVVCAGLLVWLGLNPIQARIESMWNAQSFGESRGELWRHAVALIKQFPLWGTGYGTFQYVEPLVRTQPLAILHEHAHNEYLEAAVEGGVIRFLVSVVATFLVMRMGLRAFGLYDGVAAGGLVWGALFGFTTLALHSVVEFGIHIPAIALFATVLAAQLCVLGASAPDSSDRPARAIARRVPATAAGLRWPGLVAPLGALVMSLLLGAVLVSQGWVAAKAQLFRKAANVLADRANPSDRELLMSCREAAADAAPDWAIVQVELARAHLEEWYSAQADLDRSPESDEDARAAVEDKVARDHLHPALDSYVRARDLCPLIGETHLQIASNVSALVRADPARTYLERAKRLISFDPEVWYASGLQALGAGDEARCWLDWRRSLELSDAYLPEILRVAAAALGDEGLIADVLPERADLLVRAAQVRYPNVGQATQRLPYLEKARAVIAARESPASDAETLHVAAVVEYGLGHWPDAARWYEAALLKGPRQTDWRLEYAEVLVAQGRIEAAIREVVTVQRQEPGNDRANRLYAQLSRMRSGERGDR
jgi:O-antigen ligase/tetratricopeptide (TPR) repeat protein